MIDMLNSFFTAFQIRIYEYFVSISSGVLVFIKGSSLSKSIPKTSCFHLRNGHYRIYVRGLNPYGSNNAGTGEQNPTPTLLIVIILFSND